MFAVRAAKLWHSPTFEVKRGTSLLSFKSLLKTFLWKSFHGCLKGSNVLLFFIICLSFFFQEFFFKAYKFLPVKQFLTLLNISIIYLTILI